MMTRTRFHSDDAGFTMIEVLIALAIFSIGLLAVGALQARSLKDTGDIARKTEAWTVVEDQAAYLKRLPFYEDVPSKAFPADLKDTGDWHQATALNGNYTVHWKVTDDTPIAAQTDPLFSGVPSGTYTVSKQITVVATLPNGDPDTNALAQLQFIKTWAATGIP
jgi:prepilin-type N-terminal cleavage/methylation domain-containing protein